ncbi:type II CAAX prenyl endopeptidase Rce1 family protein [Hyalangium rubrum]|uniref:CPBP family glutamic-type intramembrane protease n=1 Tax=Hyalangium rubrum TaxID=3103134 RepID=UPI003BF5A019
MEDSTPRPPLTPLWSPLLVAMVCGPTVLALFLTLGGMSQVLNAAFGLWFTEIFIFVGVCWVLLRATAYEPWSYTGLHAPQPSAAALGFGLGVANFFAFVVPIQYAAQSVAPPWLREMFDVSRIFEGQSSLELGLLIAGVSLAAPFCEEFFFRGVFQKGLLATTLSRPAAVLVTAVVFSAFHLDPVGFLARVELGVLFGALRLYTGSLWPSILAHSANNVVSSMLFLLFREAGAEAAEERPPLQAILGLMSVGVLAMGGLIALGRRFPSLWGTRREPETVAVSPPPLARSVLPWVVTATLSVGALVLVDSRGIRLSYLDIQHRLPRLPKDAPDALHAERAQLKRLRQEVRGGRVPIKVYEEELLRQAQAHPKNTR